MRATNATMIFRPQHSFCILVNLFRSFEVSVVSPVVFVFTILGGVITADLRTCFVNSTEMVIAEVTAISMDHDVPFIIVGENTGSVVD